MSLSKVSISDHNLITRLVNNIKLAGGMDKVYDDIDKGVKSLETNSYEALIALNELGNEDLQDLIKIKLPNFNY